MIKKPLLILSSVSLLALAGPPAGEAAVTILNNDFSSGVRDVQDLPNESAWYAAGPGERLFASPDDGGSLTLNQVNAGGANTGAMTYFTDSGAIEIPAGGSLSVSFDFVVNGVFDSDNNRFWVGIHNSHGSRLVQDAEVTDAGTSPGNRQMKLDKFESYTGYEAAMNIDRTPEKEDPNTSRIYRRPADNDRSRIMSNQGATGIGSSNPEGMEDLYLNDETVYHMEFLLYRFQDGESIRATLNVSGGDLLETQTMTGTDPSLIETSFDTFTIWQSRFVTSEATFTDEFIFQNFEVTYVPEPSTYALLFGAGALVVAGLYRRRHRRGAG